MTLIPMPLAEEKWNRLLDVSRFQLSATTLIKSKQIVNVYSGEILAGNIAIYEDRIAYVGEREPKIDDNTKIIDAGEQILVPGYIEPHSHPFQIYNPITLTEYGLTHGTTTFVHDNLHFYLSLSSSQMDRFHEFLSTLPVKNFWWTRLDPQTRDSQANAMFSPQLIKNHLQQSNVLQAGELTNWKEIVNGVPTARKLMYLAQQSGKRIEAHNPGASLETLSSITAAGATCCHESITAEEVFMRLRIGLYASLRYSSIRPDLPELVKGLLSKDIPVPWNRLLMTTDGSHPFFLQQGFTDYLIRLAIEAGVEPIEAYRMATLNPATYYGLDQQIGGIAPGRIADLLFLEHIKNPKPLKVMANGKLVAENGRLENRFPAIKWEEYGIQSLATGDWKAKSEWFVVKSNSAEYPVVNMKNSVILTVSLERLSVINGVVSLPSEGNFVFFALLDLEGKWITKGIVKGFAQIDALASTYTVSRNIIVLGRDHDQMAEAVNHVRKLGGGICLYDKGTLLFEMPLPLLGNMNEEKMEVLIYQTQSIVDLLTKRGYKHADPIYSLLFFTATHLPAVRFTRDGLVSVKTNEIISPCETIVEN